MADGAGWVQVLLCKGSDSLNVLLEQQCYGGDGINPGFRCQMTDESVTEGKRFGAFELPAAEAHIFEIRTGYLSGTSRVP